MHGFPTGAGHAPEGRQLIGRTFITRTGSYGGKFNPVPTHFTHLTLKMSVRDADQPFNFEYGVLGLSGYFQRAGKVFWAITGFGGYTMAYIDYNKLGSAGISAFDSGQIATIPNNTALAFKVGYVEVSIPFYRTNPFRPMLLVKYGCEVSTFAGARVSGFGGIPCPSVGNDQLIGLEVTTSTCGFAFESIVSLYGDP